MRVVLDANLFVSATIQSQGKPARILDAWRADRFDLLIREDILEEIRDVLFRHRISRRHQWTSERIDLFLDTLRELATITPGEQSSASADIKVIADDPDDDKYLACAIEGAADYVVSRDQHLLSLGELKGIRIVAPARFLEILEGNDQ